MINQIKQRRKQLQEKGVALPPEIGKEAVPRIFSVTFLHSTCIDLPDPTLDTINADLVRGEGYDRAESAVGRFESGVFYASPADGVDPEGSPMGEGMGCGDSGQGIGCKSIELSCYGNDGHKEKHPGEGR